MMLVKKQLTQRLNDLQNTHMAFEPQEDDVIEYEFFADEFRKAIKVSRYYRAFLSTVFTRLSAAALFKFSELQMWRSIGSGAL